MLKSSEANVVSNLKEKLRDNGERRPINSPYKIPIFTCPGNWACSHPSGY